MIRPRESICLVRDLSDTRSVFGRDDGLPGRGSRAAADKRPKALIHRSRPTRQVREMAVDYRQLAVGIGGTRSGFAEAVERRHKARAVPAGFAVDQKRLWRLSDDIEALLDLLA